MKVELSKYITEVMLIDSIIELIPTLEDELSPNEFCYLQEAIGLLKRYRKRLCEIEVEEVK